MKVTKQSEVTSVFELLEPREMFSVSTYEKPDVAAAHAASAIVMSAANLKAAVVTAGTGLTAEYFSDTGFATGKLIRTDAAVNLKASGKDKITKTSNSVMWTGSVVAGHTEDYTFSTVTKGGVQLTVDGQTIIDQLTGAGGTIAGNTTISMVAGQHYDITLKYVRHGGAAAAKLMWQSPSTPLEAVPTSALFPATTLPTLPEVGGALVGQYYSGENFDKLVMTRSDPNINFNFGKGTPASTIPANTPFSIRWTGQLSPAKTGLYTFATKSDDGIRVWVNGQLVIDDYHDQAAVRSDKGAINLVAGQAYEMRVDYYQNGQGFGSAKLQYSLPGGKKLNVIPSGLFTSTLPSSAGTLSTTNVTSSEVDIAWTGSSTATGYEIDRETADGDFVQIATVTPDVTTFADTGLASATEYDYRVEPLGSVGVNAQSNVLQTQTLTQTPAGPNVVSASATDVNLSWGDVAGETGFIVLDSTDGGQTFSTVGITGQGVLNYDVAGLLPGNSYQFEVEAINSNGQPSAPTSPVAQVTPVLPPLLVTALGASSSTAALTWSDATGETGFVVERSSTGISDWSAVATLPANTLAYTDTGLSGGTLYSYRVRALNAGGASAPSVSATALTVPSIVTATLAGLNLGTSSVSFPAVSGAVSYTVQRSMDGLNGWTTVSTVTPSQVNIGATLSATVPNIAPSTIYFYRVIAGNATGVSAPSAVVSQMTAPLAIYASQNQLYGVSSTNAGPASIYSLNMTSGTSTLIGQLLPGAYAANRNPVDGTISYAVGSNTNSPKIYAWDPNTGNNTQIGNPTYLAPVSKAAYDSTGLAWITDTAGNLYSITQNGASTRIGTLKVGGVPLTNTAGNLAFSSTGQLYMSNGGVVYTVNTTTAAVTPYLALGVGNISIVFGNNGLLYATDSNGHEYSLTSVLATLVPNSALPVFNSLTATPEFVDLSVTAAGTPAIFHAGQNAAYAVNVQNAGPNSADINSITVTAALGSGLSFVSLTGTGWTATTSTNALGVATVTMTYSGTLLVNGYAPTVTLNVHVASNAIIATATTFSVSGDQFDTGVLNNTAIVTSTIA